MSIRHLLCMAALLAFVPAVHAEEPDSRARAKALVKSGDTHYRMLRFKQALADYQAAFKLKDHPAILFNIAQSYRQLKEYEEARLSYKLFLSDWRKKFPDKPPPYEEEVKAHIERLAKLIESQKKAQAPQPVEAKPAHLELEGLREGMRILVDGNSRQTGPALELTPGSHRVRVELDGYAPWEREVQLASGRMHTEQVALRLRDHRTPWLVASVCLTAAAAGMMGMGVAYNVRHNRYISDTPEADEQKKLSVIGYATAGGIAAAATASWIIYLLHRRNVLRLLERERASASGTRLGSWGVLDGSVVRF